MLRNITSRNAPLTLISGEEVRDALKLSRPSFIDFALLLGTDFSRRIKHVGPSRALKFIREYDSIERVLQCEPLYTPHPEAQRKAYLAQIELARSVFLTPPPVPHAEELIPKVMNQAEVAATLSKFGLSRWIVEDEAWDPRAPLAGNYFNDNPISK